MKVFISYRREDTQGFVGRFHDRLIDDLGHKNVFLDIDNMPAGVDFRKHLQRVLEECDVVIALIGSSWLRKQESGQPVWNATDFLYLELKAALDNNIRLIPVLVDGATMPGVEQLPDDLQDLPYLHAVNISNNQRFHTDMNYLVKELKVKKTSAFPWFKTSVGLVALLAVTSGGKFAYDEWTSAQNKPVDPTISTVKKPVTHTEKIKNDVKKAVVNPPIKPKPPLPKKYPVRIKVTPKNANILVNGETYSQDSSWEKGSYAVTASAEGYITQEQSVTIDNAEKKLNFDLTKIRYPLTITTTPENARITLLDTLLDNELNYHDGMKLEPREYKIKVEAKDYKAKELTIVIESREKKTDIKLEKLKLKVEPEMVFIKGGTFTMGCLDSRDNVEGGCSDDEKPAHKVTISDFTMGKTEVTVGQFRYFIQQTNYKTTAEKKGSCWSYDAKGDWNSVKGNSWRKLGFNQTDTDPVACVSWDDTQAYIEWLNKEKGTDSYRLPTEAEWEYAARAGTDTAYSWGNSIGKGKANCYKDTCGDSFDYTSPVGSFDPSPYQLYDMHGSVWEWVEDTWHGSYEGAPKNGEAWRTEKGSHRVFRGGSWSNTPRDLRSAFRFRYSPVSRFGSLGFRLVSGQDRKMSWKSSTILDLIT